MKSPLKAHLFILFANIIYGLNYSIGKTVLLYLDPVTIVMVRISVTCILFWLLHTIFIREKTKKEDHGRLLLCGLTGVACNQLLFFKGLSLTSQIHSSLIMISTPILVLIMGWIFLRERITSQKIAGILVGFTGVFLLIATGRKNESTVHPSVVGDICIMLNASSYAIFLVIAKPLMIKYSPFTVSKWIFLYGFLFTIPFGISGLISTNWFSLPHQVLWPLIYVVLGATFFAYLFNILGLNYGSPTLVSVYIYSQPVLASLVAVTFYHEQLTIEKIVSAVFVFAGVALVSLPMNKKALNQKTES